MIRGFLGAQEPPRTAASRTRPSDSASLRALGAFLGRGSSPRRSGPTTGARGPSEVDSPSDDAARNLSDMRAATECCRKLPALSESPDYREGAPSKLCGGDDEILVDFTDWQADGAGGCTASVRCRDESRNAANCDCMLGGAAVADRMAACGGGGDEIPLGTPVEGVDDPVAATYDPATRKCWLKYTCEDGPRWVLAASQCPFVGESYSQPTTPYDQSASMPDCGGGGLGDTAPYGDASVAGGVGSLVLEGVKDARWVTLAEWLASTAVVLPFTLLASDRAPRRRDCTGVCGAYLEACIEWNRREPYWPHTTECEVCYGKCLQSPDCRWPTDPRDKCLYRDGLR